MNETVHFFAPGLKHYDIEGFNAEGSCGLFWGTILAVAVLLLRIVPGPVFNLALTAASSILP